MAHCELRWRRLSCPGEGCRRGRQVVRGHRRSQEEGRSPRHRLEVRPHRGPATRLQASTAENSGGIRILFSHRLGP